MCTNFMEWVASLKLWVALMGHNVQVIPPKADEADFVNRKGKHTLNVQAICDWQGKFTNIFAKWPGGSDVSLKSNRKFIHSHDSFSKI